MQDIIQKYFTLLIKQHYSSAFFFTAKINKMSTIWSKPSSSKSQALMYSVLWITKRQVCYKNKIRNKWWIIKIKNKIKMLNIYKRKSRSNLMRKLASVLVSTSNIMKSRVSSYKDCIFY